ncbi:SIS domain-containing protein [Porphyromonadaceae sp. NP-X]|jgi:tagatose-6-phosphate ketose/aldose isomerase|nr:SIS domain-containing protein [Porphyromonadaceae sp. NP-X]NLJ19557.1 SIS domain-containing protein [Bacteroidales bacterium]
MRLNKDIATYKEIHQQPNMWIKEYQLILQNKQKIYSFVSKRLLSKDTEIIFTGAGTSAFIGNVLSMILPQKNFFNFKVIPSSDLITHPHIFFQKEKEIVLVSFARSGNSPESMGVVNIANSLCKKISHIIITCNQNGELAKNANLDNTLLLILPPETDDKGLAMTSSFSTMLLTMLLILNIETIENEFSAIETLSLNAVKMLNSYEKEIQNIVEKKFERAVFLGSGELKGIAQECHLKLQEMTDGKIICKYDSFLGFRHGPKAVINNKTLLVYLFSDDEYVLQYEKDLVKQINKNNKVTAQIAVCGQNPVKIEKIHFDTEIFTGNTYSQVKEYGCVAYVLVGQLLGYYKSLFFGLNPDNPSLSGNISRVVEGVTIYNNFNKY